MRHGHGRSVWRDCKGIRARGCRLADLPVVDWMAPKSSAACTTVDLPPFPTVVHSRRRRCIRPHLRRLFFLNLSWCYFLFHENNDNFPAALLHEIKLTTAHSSGIRLCSPDHGSVRFHNRPPKKAPAWISIHAGVVQPASPGVGMPLPVPIRSQYGAANDVQRLKPDGAYREGWSDPTNCTNGPRGPVTKQTSSNRLERFHSRSIATSGE